MVGLLGQYLSTIVLALHRSSTGLVNGSLGALWSSHMRLLLLQVLHHMTNAIDSQLVADAGGTGLWPMIALSNIAQGSAVLLNIG